MNNNRQNNRRRGRNPNRPQGGGGRGADPQNRIDNRTRGNAVQLHEKYRNMARDAQTKGDRVEAEYWWQFADHYYRVVADQRARAEERQGGGRSQRDEWRAQAEEDDDRPGASSGSSFNGRDGSDSDDADDWRGNRQQGRDNREQGREQGRDQTRDQGRDQGRNTPDRADEHATGDSEDEDTAEVSARPTRRTRRTQPVEAADGENAPKPRRGRPRKSAGNGSDGNGDGADGDGADGAARLDSDVLPPSISAPDGETPRRRGRPRKVVTDEGSAAA